MNYLLDTNICSAFLKRPGRLAHRFVQYSGRLAISVISLAELLTWAYRKPDPTNLLRMISDDLLAEIPVLGFDLECAERYGKVRADLLTAGITVNPVDLMIAATALEHGLTVVTNNVRHFEVIPGLKLEDWLSK